MMTLRSQLRIRFSSWAAALFAVFSLPLAAPAEPDLEVLIGRALERSRWYEEHRVETWFEFDMERVSEKLDGEGRVSSREEFAYRVFPLAEQGGVQVERLVGKDGRALSDSERRDEEKRLEKLQRELRSGRERKGRNRERVVFDEKLVSKYLFTFGGREMVGGIEAVRMNFRPRPGELPVENRMDQALNKAEGAIWVHEPSAEILRVSFELKEKIPIWWGLLGSISAVRGTIERSEVAPGIWMPNRFEMYLNGRVMFASLHRQERMKWDNFRRVSEQELAALGE